MASPLENLSGPGRALQKEAPDAKEFAGLRRSALARLTDSAKNSNSLESRFDLAYNAAHALCLAALRWLDTDRPIVTSSFKCCHTHSDWVPKYGACSINAIQFATLVNMKAISISMNGLWQI